MTDWSQAVCLNADPDLFFPEKGDHQSASQAKRICGRCPIRQDCLDWALETAEPFGIFGGLQSHERRTVRRMAGMDAPPVRRSSAATVDRRCGSTAGYKRHQKADEEPCGACRRAWAAYKRDHDAKRRAA